MTRFERILNAAATTTNEVLDASETVITVTDGSVFPAEGDYRLIIEDEVVLVIDRATDDLTVERGADATTAATHSTGLTIKTVITEEAMKRYIRDFVDPAAFDRPPNRLLDASGATLTTSDFTNLNFGTGTIQDESDGSLTLKMQQGAAPNLRLVHKSMPSTPFTLTAHLLTSFGANAAADNANVIGFRESGTGKISHISFHPSHKFFIQYLDDPTTSGPASSANQDISGRYDCWSKIEHDGTNLKYFGSTDGVSFFEIHSELKTFHFTTDADEIIWGGDNQGVDDQMIHLKAWIEEEG